MTGGTTETTVWQGTPSQLVNVPNYILLALGGVLGTVGLLFLRGMSTVGGTAEPGSGSIFLWLIALVWIACIGLGVAQYLRTSTTKYVVTSERLRITTGVLSTVSEDIELRRVRDTVVVKPFLKRIVGLGDIHLLSADLSAPRVTLRAIKNPDELQSKIRSLVQSLYGRFGVREIDVM